MFPAADTITLTLASETFVRQARLQATVQKMGEVIRDEQVKEWYTKGGQKQSSKRVRLYKNPAFVALNETIVHARGLLSDLHRQQAEQGPANAAKDEFLTFLEGDSQN